MAAMPRQTPALASSLAPILVLTNTARRTGSLLTLAGDNSRFWTEHNAIVDESFCNKRTTGRRDYCLSPLGVVCRLVLPLRHFGIFDDLVSIVEIGTFCVPEALGSSLSTCGGGVSSIQISPARGRTSSRRMQPKSASFLSSAGRAPVVPGCPL
ncbi:hypothetical protein EDC01DRAFT_152296 [Geopyxis carbonaria]|nr:hypothetical protein EDC01DRAFT_152296 [Geopyxis carbonaria]